MNAILYGQNFTSDFVGDAVYAIIRGNISRNLCFRALASQPRTLSTNLRDAVGEE